MTTQQINIPVALCTNRSDEKGLFIQRRFVNYIGYITLNGMAIADKEMGRSSCDLFKDTT
jgi:hypothetical protein